MTDWHALERDAVLERLQATPTGLTEVEAADRLRQYGPNQLQERRIRSPWAVFAAQFAEVMVIVLLVAAGVSFAIGEPTDGVMIVVIIALNVILGFSQEYRAERAMAALKRLAVPMVKVRRGGQVCEVPSSDVVPGDIFLLEAGSRVPADGRVLESANMRVDESPLTGESVPVDKAIHVINGEKLPLGDRKNMVYMGTAVVYGRGAAVTVGTGMNTELGNIAELLQAVRDEKTPLQRRTAELGKWLAIGALVIVMIVFALGVCRGEALSEMLLTAISLAVAAVPEGLPAVVTITLALGAQRMVRRNALIRKLPAVETLGSVTVICSDKTGTLTENRMTVTVLDVAGRSLTLGEGLPDVATRTAPDGAPPGRPEPAIALLLAGGTLCNDATLEHDQSSTDGYRAVGDPTEGALVVAAARMGMWKAQLEHAMPRLAEVPFTSERKRMTTVHRLPASKECVFGEPMDGLCSSLPDVPYTAFTKGSVDGLLQICNRVWIRGKLQALDDTWRRRIQSANDRLASDGVRVIGLAMRPFECLPEQLSETSLEKELVFVGMSGMVDPPRAEVRQAVEECRAAGIRPIMITGDHPLTALHIARQLGIVQQETGQARVLTGQELALMSVEDLEGVVDEVSVYARASPEHKVKIVDALKRKGHYVAMTGDGVNDAPALKRADIGVAMGLTGTDVSKEAADMVLLDDNFATIVHAIEEGRTIYENIRKFMRYIISSNIGEILIMLVAPLLGWPIPLTAIQLLWVNLVTDGLPALALAVEPADPKAMQRPPSPPSESVLARGAGSYMICVGLLLASASLGAMFWGHSMGRGSWQTMIFATLALSQMGNALAIRSDRESLFRLGLLSNRPLLGAVLLTVVLQGAVIYLPTMQRIFGTTSLTGGELAISVAFASIVFIVVEARKEILRLRERARAER